MTVDIHKAGGIILKDRRLLVVRAKGKSIFNTPGGKLEPTETSRQALVRELQEEVQIDVKEEHVREFGTFYSNVVGRPDKTFRMDVFFVKQWHGDIRVDNEIEELRWINTSNMDVLELSPVFKHEIIPRMKKQGLID